ncbi:MAG: tyrosine--tRNA ligase [Waddliaceae bacterium]|nr:tyrosine--tRNA ligase [Waddliaceae bacterium]
MSSIIEVLEERGFIESKTSESFRPYSEDSVRLYAGFDPTGDSLHIGHLIPLMGLAWFQKFGHQPIALIGGATALVGDPSGKDKERPLLSEDTVNQNIEGIRRNLHQVLDFENESTKPLVLNNYDWHSRFTFIDFLRDVGKYFRLGTMLSKESVKKRLQSDEGMSYTEFAYQTLQGYDFYHLFKEHKVCLQLGGSDQWGNIIAGTELVRKLTSKEVYGVTFPLLTRSDGKKFGKTEGGAIWLSSDRCSPYDFYQYLYGTPDADVVKFMRLLTFMDMAEIQKYEELLKDPESPPNQAQKRLAQEVTRIVHGEEGLRIAEEVTSAARPGSQASLDAKTLESLAGDMPTVTLQRQDLIGLSYIDLLVKIDLQKSKGEARRLIRNGGAYLNNKKIVDEDFQLSNDEFIEDRLILVGAGKKKKVLVKVINS